MKRQRATCEGQDPEIWFPVGTGGPATMQEDQAKALCRVCPLMEACGQDALERGTEFGIWGGMTEHERRVIRSRGNINVRSKDADHRDRSSLARALESVA